MKKQLLVISALMLVGTLASCGGGNHNPGAVSDSTINPSTTSQETTSEGTSTTSEGTSNTSEFTPEVTYPLLTVHLYQRYVDNDCSASLKKQFEDELVNQKAAVTKLNWVMGTGAAKESVADYSVDLENYDKDHTTETIDVVLGAKGNVPYLSSNFETLKKADGSGNVTMTTINGDTTSTDRYIWIRKGTVNLEAVKVLVKGVADYDWPADPEDPTSETTSETTSEEQTSETTSEETTSESGDVVLDQLSVFVYEKFVSETCSSELKTKFTTYLTTNHITITNFTWELDVKGAVADVNTAISTYDTAHSTATIDVILGGRAWSNCTYINDNFEYIKDADNNEINMSTTDAKGETSTNRRIWVRKGSSNTQAISHLVNALTAA